MGIHYFYNFCIREIDDTDLESDILSAVRKSYFASFEKIRDKITYDSEGISMLYDYCIERDKPLRWTVKNLHGGTVEEVLPADGDRYYLCFYRGDQLFKRLLFSKLHTLLKAEYMDDNGAVSCYIEPRKIQGGLCLLYQDSRLDQPIVLYAMPDVSNERIEEQMKRQYKDYTVEASTNEGVVRFLSDSQMAHFREFVDKVQAAINNEEETSFVGSDAPLFEKINAKDFNMKRNLSASLDISEAKNFGVVAAEEEAVTIHNSVDDIPDVSDTPAVDTNVSENKSDENSVALSQSTEASGAKPDKLIKADGAVYSYYGELDASGNRSGYGRTLTDLGRTAYEGQYLNDKRSGKGAYFYKDGTLCYSGDWSENVRHGVGIGVSARDGSLHVGKWVNNKPEGNGTRITADGEIKFVCKELSDGCTVLMNYLDDDPVVISKYDKNGSKLSEKKISLIDN